MSIPTPTKLNLTIQNGCIARNVKSPVSGKDVENMLGLFDGHTVEANVYSGTNKCFDVTPDMILSAWKKLDKEKIFWISQEDIEHLIKRFTTVNEYGNTLAMCLPNLFCKETPAEIELMLK